MGGQGGHKYSDDAGLNRLLCAIYEDEPGYFRIVPARPGLLTRLGRRLRRRTPGGPAPGADPAGPLNLAWPPPKGGGA